MIIYHFSYFQRKFYLWAESAKGEQPISANYAEGDTIANHPFAADHAALHNLCKTLSVDNLLKTVQDVTITNWIPGYSDTPLPSTSLLPIEIERQEDPTIIPFYCPSLQLTVLELLEFLSASNPFKGIIPGHEVCWLKSMVQFAGSQVVHENFLPGLHYEKSWEGRWETILDEEQEKQLEKIIRQFPASMYCSTIETDTPEYNKESLVVFILNTLVDDLVREANSPPLSFNETFTSASFTCVHEAWLASLRSRQPELAWDDVNEIRELRNQLKQWRKAVDLIYHSPFRLCFRLESPDVVNELGLVVNDKDWHISYHVQLKNDFSTIIPIQDVWLRHENSDELIKQYGDRVTEFLLIGLGLASGISPTISKSLNSKHPTGVDIDLQEAYDFLQGEATRLKQIGFGVMLPSWWANDKMNSRKVGVRMKVSSEGKDPSLGDICEFDYELALGDDKITAEELERLTEQKVPLVQIRGQWVELDGKSLQAVKKFWERNNSGSMKAEELLYLALSSEDEVRHVPIHGVDMQGWLEKLLDVLQGRESFNIMPQPEKFVGELRAYQERGYSWLAFLAQWNLGACLADDMGLGKTIQALALLEQFKAENKKINTSIIICPTSVLNNWFKEAEKFTPNLSVMIHHGTDRLKNKEFFTEIAKHDLIITSYGLLQRDSRFLKKVQWFSLILDEAQNIKNASTNQSKAARQLKSDFRIALTGTPVENHIGDLWSIMDFLNPGLLGTQRSFRQKYLRPIQVLGDEKVAKQLQTLTSPFIMRRLKTDKNIIDDLPEKQEVKTFCTLTREQASLYSAVLKNIENNLYEGSGIKRKGQVLAALTKLKQVCNHPAQFLGDDSVLDKRSGKLMRLEEMLQEIIEMKEHVLIFTQYAQMGKLLQKHLQETFGREMFFLHGGTSRKERDRMITSFQEDEYAPPAFILSLKAGGTGLTLTRANHVIHYDRWWNPAVENQATDRAYRIGQTKNVQVYKFICAGTLEERIDKMITKKLALADSVVSTGERWLTELDDNELQNLLALNEDMVGE